MSFSCHVDIRLIVLVGEISFKALSLTDLWEKEKRMMRQHRIGKKSVLTLAVTTDIDQTSVGGIWDFFFKPHWEGRIF